MDKQDQHIKKVLKDMQSPVNDPEFTARIVSMHLEKQESKPFVNQLDIASLLTGLIAVFASLLVVYLNAVLDIGLTEDLLAVIQILPVLYLLFQLLNEYASHQYRQGFKFRAAALSLCIGLMCLASQLYFQEQIKSEQTQVLYHATVMPEEVVTDKEISP